MDGTRLIRHKHPLPKLAVTATSTPAEKSKARSRFVAVVATLVLAGVMALVYYVSIRQPARTTTVAISPTAVESAQPNPEASPVAASDNSAIPQTDASEKAKTVTSTDTGPGTTDKSKVTEPDTPNSETKPSPKPETNRTIKSTSQGRSTSQTSATVAKPEEKDDSKVRTALKKTGRFFKKALPF